MADPPPTCHHHAPGILPARPTRDPSHFKCSLPAGRRPDSPRYGSCKRVMHKGSQLVLTTSKAGVRRRGIFLSILDYCDPGHPSFFWASCSVEDECSASHYFNSFLADGPPAPGGPSILIETTNRRVARYPAKKTDTGGNEHDLPWRRGPAVVVPF